MLFDEQSVVDYVVDAAHDGVLTASERLLIADRIGLGDAEWLEQLAADGFSEVDVARLDDLIGAWLNPDNLRRLTQSLRDVHDPSDKDELSPIAWEWMGQGIRGELSQQIGDAGFPNLTDAICYMVCEVGRAFISAVTVEEMRRQIAATPFMDWEIDPVDLALGQAIADEGLSKDARTWPAY